MQQTSHHPAHHPAPGQAPIPPASTRETEQQVLGRITSRLDDARQAGDMAALAQALGQVETLWRVFVAEATNDSNPLPKGLRDLIANVGMTVLSEINGRQTSDVDVGFVLDINNAVLDGLSGR
ncbi:MAG: Flagellar protein FlaF [Pseudomonadota bacterium]